MSKVTKLLDQVIENCDGDIDEAFKTIISMFLSFTVAYVKARSSQEDADNNIHFTCDGQRSITIHKVGERTNPWCKPEFQERIKDVLSRVSESAEDGKLADVSELLKELCHESPT